MTYERLPMARLIRIEYLGAVYHVMTRGNYRQQVFKAPADSARSYHLLITEVLPPIYP